MHERVVKSRGGDVCPGEINIEPEKMMGLGR